MTAINSVADLAHEGEVAVITLNSPPVNALSEIMREGLIAALKAAEAEPALKATLLICAGRTFIAGADISEFDKVQKGASLRDVQNTMDAAKKPIVVAIHGTALGGGLETAMCGHYRVAVPSAKLGQPEVMLGIVPGAGGTQRLPRLVGVEKALQMVSDGKPISAEEGFKLGLIDALMPEKDLKGGALDFARQIIAQNKGIRRTRDGNEKISGISPQVFADFRQNHDFKGFAAPGEAIKCVEAATTMPFDQGLDFEMRVFLRLQGFAAKQGATLCLFCRTQGSERFPDLPKTPEHFRSKAWAWSAPGLWAAASPPYLPMRGLPVTIVEAEVRGAGSRA